MQQVLLHSTAVEKVQQVHQQHADVVKKHFAQKLQAETEQKKKEVQDANESEEARIREEERGGQHKKGSTADASAGEEEGATQKTAALEEADKGTILDLTV
jgi:activator of HSP90 ATPase